MSDTTSCTDTGITPASTIDDVIARHPSSIFVLNTFGIDTCCGGSDSIAQAAAYAHVDLAALLAGLQRAAQS